MTSTTVLFRSEKISSCTLPVYWTYYLSYQFPTTDPVQASVSKFHLLASTGNWLIWAKTETNDWVGGLEESQFILTNEFKLEITNILLNLNYT